MVRIWMAAIAWSWPPSTWLSSKVGSYSHIAIVFWTAPILVIALMIANSARAMTWSRHLRSKKLKKLKQIKNDRAEKGLMEPGGSLQSTPEAFNWPGWAQSSHMRYCWCWCCPSSHRTAKFCWFLLCDWACVWKDWHTFDWFFPVISTLFVSPTMYLPILLPSWPPCVTLKLMTAAFNFHFSFFSAEIQWAVIPRTEAFIVSTVQPSAVSDINSTSSDYARWVFSLFNSTILTNQKFFFQFL